MVVGLRMGLIALEMLDAYGWFDLRCKALLHWGPPDSCVIDGIQVSSGCTMGKHNLDIVEQDSVQVEFFKGNRMLKIILRNNVLENIRKNLSSENDENVKNIMRELIEAPQEELFEIIVSSLHSC